MQGQVLLSIFYILYIELFSSSVVLVLRLLPLLLPCSTVKGAANKPFWKLSKAEVQDGFVMHVTV